MALQRGEERRMLVLGLMSGTSADGIDVALAQVEEEFVAHRFACSVSQKTNRAAEALWQNSGRMRHGRQPWSGSHDQVRRKLVAHATMGMNAEVRKTVLRVADGGSCTAGEISQLNFRMGEEFAAAAAAACKKFGVRLKEVGLIGSHGQTIFHRGSAVGFLGAKMASTLQIGEPALIAARTGIPTVGDFRVADMAAGGQGAPLVPYVDWLLLRHEQIGRVALNLGGIGNVTVLPANNRRPGISKERPAKKSTFNRLPFAASDKINRRRAFTSREPDTTQQARDWKESGQGAVMAFDTGPGNMVIDALVAHFTKGRLKYDRDGRMARAGRCITSLLGELLQDAYLRLAPPKSTGREYYGWEFVERLLEKARKYRMRPEDLVRTATVFTALSVVDALNRFVLPRVEIGQVIVSGGGAKNPVIMAQMAAALAPISVMRSSEVGVPEEAKEAYAFALLAYETWRGRTGNLPSATGARKSVVLGKVCWP